MLLPNHNQVNQVKNKNKHLPPKLNQDLPVHPVQMLNRNFKAVANQYGTVSLNYKSLNFFQLWQKVELVRWMLKSVEQNVQ